MHKRPLILRATPCEEGVDADVDEGDMSGDDESYEVGIAFGDG